MTDHTPEPWVDSPFNTQYGRAVLDRKDWNRAKACVRACAGIPTEQLGDVKALVDALTYYQDTFCEGFCSDGPQEYTSPEVERDCSGCKARAALARFRKD